MCNAACAQPSSNVCKHAKYTDCCRQSNVSVTAFVLSTFGMLGELSAFSVASAWLGGVAPWMTTIHKMCAVTCSSFK